MTNINNNENLDNSLFDRLVDGELSAPERAQLLASFDDPQSDWHVQGWRKCALAFLEAQAWGGEFKRMVAEPVEEAVPVVSPARATHPNASAGRWFAIAASLLVAFGLGWFVRLPSSTEVPQPTFAHIDEQVSPLRDDFPDQLLDDPDNAVTLLVRDTSGQNRRLQVPLMEVESLDKHFADALPAELRDRFRDKGYDLHRRRRFAPVFFEQNQQLVPMVVPVDDTYLVPVKMPIY